MSIANCDFQKWMAILKLLIEHDAEKPLEKVQIGSNKKTHDENKVDGEEEKEE